MAKSKQQGEGGVSLRSKDAIQTGLFGGGRCELGFIFGEFDYGARGRHPALIVTFKTEDGDANEEPYGVGSGWKIASDGSHLIPRQGQTGLGKNTDAMLYMITPLEEAMELAGLEWPGDGSDISTLDGLVADVVRRPVQERDFGDRKQARDESKGPKTKLVITEIVSAPWDESGKKSQPASKAKAKAQGEDDEDDDEAPAPKKGAAKASKAKATGEDEESELDAQAQQAIIDALEDEDGPLSVEDLGDVILAALKGNPERKAIAARAIDAEFLATGAGWAYNKRKGLVTLG